MKHSRVYHIYVCIHQTLCTSEACFCTSEHNYVFVHISIYDKRMNLDTMTHSDIPVMFVSQEAHQHLCFPSFSTTSQRPFGSSVICTTFSGSGVRSCCFLCVCVSFSKGSCVKIATIT